MNELAVQPKPEDWKVSIQKSGLDEQKRVTLTETFSPFFAEIDKYREIAFEISVTDVSQIEKMKQARELRLKLVKVRTGIESKRKELKEQSLRESKMIDSVAKVGQLALEDTEAYLEKQEKFAENLEKQRLDLLQTNRSTMLQEIGLDPTLYDLRKMTEEGFKNLYEGTKLRAQQEKERLQREEEERIAAEKKRLEDEQRIREENERLKAEKELKEKELQAQREKQQRLLEELQEKAAAEKKSLEAKAEKARKEQEAKLRKEREERERIEAEAKRKQAEQEAENKRLQDEIKAKEKADQDAKDKAEREEKDRIKAQQEADAKAKRAPDKDKLLAFAKTIESLPFPEVKSMEALAVVEDIKQLIKKLTTFINQKAEGI